MLLTYCLYLYTQPINEPTVVLAIRFRYIYIRNPLSFNFSPKNCLIKGNLTLATPISLILFLSI